MPHIGGVAVRTMRRYVALFNDSQQEFGIIPSQSRMRDLIWLVCSLCDPVKNIAAQEYSAIVFCRVPAALTVSQLLSNAFCCRQKPEQKVGKVLSVCLPCPRFV